MRRFVDPGAAFVLACKERFRFLEEQHGYERAVVDGGRAVLYRNGATGVKVELDPREDDVRVTLVRLVDGRLPPVFAYAPSHRLDLDRVLAARGRAAVVRREHDERFTAEYVDRVLAESAEALRAHAADIVAGDVSVFEELSR